VEAGCFFVRVLITPLNPDSEEGATKVTKPHEIRSPGGILWLFQNGETGMACNLMPFVKFRVLRGFNFCFRAKKLSVREAAKKNARNPRLRISGI
jgi:hypothetical protein